MSKLQEHLSSSETTLSEFARRVNLSRSYVCEIATGKKSPALETALRISDATNGAVSVRDLLRAGK
jgi:transcriptional regulator with XRE-family HTH domain